MPPVHAYDDPQVEKESMRFKVHPGRLTWNLQITHLERKMIFQTSMIMVHVNLPGCIGIFLFWTKPVLF